jgi:hypothetical protein
MHLHLCHVNFTTWIRYDTHITIVNMRLQWNSKSEIVYKCLRNCFKFLWGY